ncbi:hypothetical protein LCGC14_1441220 [marine sediment metagenome]|uniref:Uncharacterized protein n=1 Tax=marine sediment metagenome TaxID=412755 RepID=A0A0F9MMJ9_9ZZZZ
MMADRIQPGWDDVLVEDKYRVFYGPGSHVGVSAYYRTGPSVVESPRKLLREVEGFVFVLRPEVDSAAVVALAAYAAAIRHEKPQLAKDLWEMINEWV